MCHALGLDAAHRHIVCEYWECVTTVCMWVQLVQVWGWRGFSYITVMVADPPHLSQKGVVSTFCSCGHICIACCRSVSPFSELTQTAFCS